MSRAEEPERRENASPAWVGSFEGPLTRPQFPATCHCAEQSDVAIPLV